VDRSAVGARVGEHTLDELQVGSTWRCGANGITTLTADAPLIVDDLVVPPGVDRVNVARPEKEKFGLTVEGAGRWTAAGGDDVLVPALAAPTRPRSSTAR
jgi:hypothetical protein